MTLYIGPETEAASRAKPVPARAKSKLQFSLSALMFAVLATALACTALRWLGSVWLVPLVLANLGAASLTMAVRRRHGLAEVFVGGAGGQHQRDRTMGIAPKTESPTGPRRQATLAAMEPAAVCC